MEDGDTENITHEGDTSFCIFESENGLYQVYFFAGM